MSLRDVERVLDVFCWFYDQTKHENSLLNVMKKVDDSKDVVDEEELELIKVFVKSTIPDYQKTRWFEKRTIMNLFYFSEYKQFNSIVSFSTRSVLPCIT